MHHTKTRSRNDVGSPRSTSFNNFFHTGSHILRSSSHSEVIHKNRQEESVFPMNEQAFPIRYSFPIQVPKELPRTVFPTRSQQVDVRKIVVREDPLFDQDYGHLCRGRRTQKSGHSGSLESSTTSERPPCPVQSGSPAISSITFAAVIDKANDPCYVNTAYAPESSFTMSFGSKTRPLYFWCSGSDSDFLR